MVRPDQINRKWKNYEHYVDNAKSLGKLLLLARRLCEAGAGFVTVTTNFVWDMHADVNNAHVPKECAIMGPPLDHAVSALVEDLHARRPERRILLVCCGEMGRTPRLNAHGGRDHWGNLAPLLVSGGGLRMGQVIGRLNARRQSATVRSDRHPEPGRHRDANAGRPGQLAVVRGMPNEVVQATTADPIPGLA